MPEYVVVHGYQRYNQEEAIDVAKKEVAKGKPDMLVCEVIKVVRSQVVVEDAPKRAPYKKRGKKAAEGLAGTEPLEILSFAPPKQEPDGMFQCELVTNRGNFTGSGGTACEATNHAVIQAGIILASDMEKVPDSLGKRQLESWNG